MGYDIFSMREDRDRAIAYDKKWGNTFWFDKDTGEYARQSNTVYYRQNIWGMAVLRDINTALGLADLNDSLYDNSGTVIRDWECERYADAIDAKTDEEITKEVRIVLASHDLITPLSTGLLSGDQEEEVVAWVKEVRAWSDFLRTCADLKGAEVC